MIPTGTVHIILDVHRLDFGGDHFIAKNAGARSVVYSLVAHVFHLTVKPVVLLVSLLDQSSSHICSATLHENIGAA